MKSLLFVFVGGGLGASLRYLISLALSNLFQTDSYWATYSANVLGCFIIGILSAYHAQSLIDKEAYLLLAVGLCGGFTTYSTFSLEVLAMMTKLSYLKATLYAFSTLLSCLIGTYLGYTLGRMLYLIK